MDSLHTAKGVECPQGGCDKVAFLVRTMRKYLRIGPNIFAGITMPHATDFPNAIEWVDSPVRATVDITEKAKETQRKLAELGIETHLLEIPDLLRSGARWVIYRDD